MGLIFNSRRASYQHLAVHSLFTLFRVALLSFRLIEGMVKCINAMDWPDKSVRTSTDHTQEIFFEVLDEAFISLLLEMQRRESPPFN